MLMELGIKEVIENVTEFLSLKFQKIINLKVKKKSLNLKFQNSFKFKISKENLTLKFQKILNLKFKKI